MFYHIVYQWHVYISFLNVFRYISVRAAFAAITAFAVTLIAGKYIIEKLKKLKVGQVIRPDGPQKHLSKEGTPTMGGIIIIIAFFTSMLLWARFDDTYTYYILVSVAWFGLIGFLDDYLKLKIGTKGLSIQNKLILQFIGAFIIVLLYVFLEKGGFKCLTCISIPFIKYPITLAMWFYVVFTAFVIASWSNAVNLTDGLDGLAAGIALFVYATFGVMAYIIGNSRLSEYLLLIYVAKSSEITVVCSAFVGTLLGFLWFNTYPAEVFMGDVGSLMLGGVIGTISVLIKQEILLLLVGGIFVIELFSVILQVTSFKLTKKRIFMMAPLHHHFELKGISEPKIIIRFWIVTIIILLFTLSTLKLR